MWVRRIVDAAVPTAVAAIAFLHAHAIGALIDATVPTALGQAPAPPATIAAFAEARAASADPILDRNPFDHTTHLGSQRSAPADVDLDAQAVPPCEGVRAAVTVRAADDGASFAALDVRGKKFLRRRGGEAEGLRIVDVGADRVWLLRDGKICVTTVFDPVTVAPGASAAAPPPPAGPLEKDLTGKIVRNGNEFQVDRGALDHLLEAQAELMKTPLVPEKDGDRIVGYRLVRVKPGTAVAMLGLETGDRLESINGIEVTSVEKMMQGYALLRTGSVDRMTLHVTRGGKPLNLDYVIR
jgi:general secretion pathway protein C